MHKKNWDRSSERGNALVYVLIAIALFAGLGMVLSNSTRNSNTSELDDAKVEFYATQILAYASQAQSVLDQMAFTGTSLNELDVTMPGEAGFNTPPNIHKIFHPQGGGLAVPQLDKDAIEPEWASRAGMFVINQTNIDWTSSNADDVILAVLFVNRQVCARINEMITGSASIPNFSGATIEGIFENQTTDLTAAICPSCNDAPTLCLQRSGLGEAYAFYSILAER